MEKNKIPNLIYVILKNARYHIVCPCTGRVDPYTVPISSSIVMGASTAVRVSITAEESQYFFIVHNSAIIKLTKNSNPVPPLPKCSVQFYNEVTICYDK